MLSLLLNLLNFMFNRRFSLWILIRIAEPNSKSLHLPLNVEAVSDENLNQRKERLYSFSVVPNSATRLFRG